MRVASPHVLDRVKLGSFRRNCVFLRRAAQPLSNEIGFVSEGFMCVSPARMLWTERYWVRFAEIVCSSPGTHNPLPNEIGFVSKTSRVASPARTPSTERNWVRFAELVCPVASPHNPLPCEIGFVSQNSCIGRRAAQPLRSKFGFVRGRNQPRPTPGRKSFASTFSGETQAQCFAYLHNTHCCPIRCNNSMFPRGRDRYSRYRRIIRINVEKSQKSPCDGK